ncbi:hypothetical protein NQ176_g558 [Zarea fungicola]|uniref:Uncharacterized protein n=1 Tax=Zarea fungicola TaxID=93591 RepID=A0ACC1NW84_9HYPO|nr:hypothetical protein NQ176_g558 [Lecanicillium fungicola]
METDAIYPYGKHQTCSANSPTQNHGKDLESWQRESGVELSNFEYQPLTKSHREIRLIKAAWKGSLAEDSALTMVLETVSLDKSPPFITISYAWGNPEMNHTVICNGRRLLITANLSTALRSIFALVNRSTTELFSPGDELRFWVDSICINQKDSMEKSEQVALMKDIYSQSDGTIAYLGAPQDGGDPNDGFMTSCLAIKVVPLGYGEIESKPDSFIQLQKQPFFNRAWIFQEMILSRRVLCLYGNERKLTSWDFDMFMHMHTPDFDEYRSDHNLPIRTPTLEAPFHVIRRSGLNQEAWRFFRNQRQTHPEGFDPLILLSDSRRAEASDARDKVYALLGLAREEYRQAITVDYSSKNTSAKTFLDFAIACIQLDSGTRILEQAGISQQMSGLPSWVPNWTVETRYERSDSFGCFKCAGSTEALMFPSDCSTKLIISGWIMGDVKRTGFGLRYHDLELNGIDSEHVSLPLAIACVETLAYMWCKTHVTEKFQHSESGKSADVIRRTLWMGRNAWGHRWTPADRKYHEAWLAQYPRQEDPTMTPPKLSTMPTGDAEKFMLGAVNMMERVLALIRVRTSGGIALAMLPIDAANGDVVVVFEGGRVPFVLRPVKETDEYRLVGSCFVDGAMDGELIDESSNVPSFITGEAAKYFILR